MSELTLSIVVTSRWHHGTGRGEPGRTDATTRTEPLAGAVIGGEAVKGLLRDRAELVAVAYDGALADTLAVIFGTAASPGNWLFGSARSIEPDVPVQVGTFHARDPRTGVVSENNLHDRELVDPVELRATIRPVDGHEPADVEIALLAASALALTGVGTRRNRGLGRCRADVRRGHDTAHTLIAGLPT